MGSFSTGLAKSLFRKGGAKGFLKSRFRSSVRKQFGLAKGLNFSTKSVFKVSVGEFLEKLGVKTGLGLDQVGKQAVFLAKQLVSVPNPGGKSPSAPGEPPRLITGRGMRSIKYEVIDKTVVVFAKAKHMNLLDAGTSRVDPRPWKSILLQKHSTALGRAFKVR